VRAMRLTAPAPIDERPLEFAQVADPVPGPGQVRLRVSACGVCHTDLHTVEGELTLPRLPVTPGHQIVGRVDAAGPGTTRYRLGERVGVGWLGWACGECEQCLQARENLCPDARFTGLHSDGGYADLALADERFAYALPAGFTDVEAAPLLCAGVIGYRALRLSEIRPGGSLGLYGFGASAHIAIQVARHWGCAVYAFSRGSEHRRLAAELGATWTGTSDDAPPVALDSGILFAPAGALVPVALRHLRPGGTLAINAVYMSAIPELRYEWVYGERTVRSVANFTRQDAVDFLQLAAAIPVRTEVEVHPLREANAVLLRLKGGQVQGSAVLRVAE